MIFDRARSLVDQFLLYFLLVLVVGDGTGIT